MMSPALMLCALLRGVPVGAQEPPNLVRNPGFEEITTEEFAAQWRGGEFGKPGSNVALDRSVAHQGNCSMRLGISPYSFVTCAAAPIAIKPRTTYHVSWWCKTEGLQQARAYVFLQTDQGQRVFEDPDTCGTRDWTLHLGQYTTTEDETWLYPVLATQDMGGPPCAAWFDDVAVYEGGFPEPLATQWRALERERSGASDCARLLMRTPQVTVWSDCLSARIFAEDGVPADAEGADRVELSAARNEEEFVQLAMVPTADLEQVRVAPSDLIGPGVIPASHVRWWPVGQVHVKVAQNPRTRLGATPDPLLEPSPVPAPVGKNTVFCLGIRIPKDAPPGDYQGAVSILGGQQEIARVPVSLRVWDFTLPPDPTFRTLITFSPGNSEQAICRLLYEHGIRGNGATVTADARIEDGRVVCDFTTLDARVGWVLNHLNFNAFFLGPCFGGGTSEGWEAHARWLGMEPLSEEFNRLFPQYMRQVGQHLREKGWLDKAYLYLWDEPEPDYFDKVVALQKLALEGDPGLKVWETTSPSHRAFWGVVKAWSVPFTRPYFDEQAVDARRRAGDEIWVYNIPATLEGPPQVHRLWFWQAARYGAIGAQLWNINFYHGIDPWEEITPRPYPVGRGRTALYHYQAGEAILIYPNPRGIGPPLPSLRLKLVQKGIDDFEYLTILQRRLQESARRRGAADPAGEAQEQMRQVTGQLVRDINRFALSTRELERVRAEVARAIQRAGSDQ